MLTLGPIGFLQPLVLLGLAALPALYILVRILPPRPRRVIFPAVRFLFGLQSPERTSSSAPWWLIALRLLMATLLILAFAGPVLRPNVQLQGPGAVLIVIDNGWASGGHWTEMEAEAEKLIARADEAGLPVRIGEVAPSLAASGEVSPPVISDPLPTSEALGRIRAIRPVPWQTDRTGLADALARVMAEDAPLSNAFWISDGTASPGDAGFLEQLRRLPNLAILAPNLAPNPAPDTSGLPIVLKEDGNPSATPSAIAEWPAGAPLAAGSSPDKHSIGAELLAMDGRVLARTDVPAPGGADSDGTFRSKIGFEIPGQLAGEAAMIRLEGQNHAAATLLLDDRYRRHPVGIATNDAAGEELALLSEGYYIGKALSPHGILSRAPVASLVRAGLSVIIVPDAVPLDDEAANMLLKWVEDGGVLVRFAGPRMAAQDNNRLVPVALRHGGRVLEGAMTWSRPAHLGPFPKDSPFADMAVPDDITIKRQVLAEPDENLRKATWAMLDDGTPLVTSAVRGKGRLVLFHTMANAEWSDFPLSGVFEQMLVRIVKMGAGKALEGSDGTGAPLPQEARLDGRGNLAKPLPGAQPLMMEQRKAGTVIPDPKTPPGFYGSGFLGKDRNLVPVNLGPALPRVEPFAMDGLPAPAAFGMDRSLPVTGPVLAAALILLICDALASLILGGQFPGIPGFGRNFTDKGKRTGKAIGMILLAFMLGGVQAAFPLASAHAQENTPEGMHDRKAMQAALGTVLAYVITGDSRIDAESRAGLNGLSAVINDRTAAEMAPPAGIDPATDELSIYPLIYWPVPENATPVSADVRRNINTYLAHGGTILFDTRNGIEADLNSGQPALAALTRGLDIPPLIPVPPDHVLTKSFYLLSDFPGRWKGSSLWVEKPGSGALDGVARVIAGDNDWAGAWAVDDQGTPLFPVIPGGEEQREMAMRFGVNLVMYTLTGNYKSDQVHVPAILERLGQ